MAYSQDLRIKVLAHYKNTSDSIRKVSIIFGISPQTFQKWLKLDKAGLDLQYKTSPGRPPLLSEKHEQRLIQLVETEKNWTQKKMAEVLSEEFGFKISQVVICFALQRLGFTYKKNSGELMKRRQSEYKN